MSELAILVGAPVRRTPFPCYPILGDTEVEAVTAAVRTHNLSAQMGEVAKAFELEFAAYRGARFAVATSRGTTALVRDRHARYLDRKLGRAVLVSGHSRGDRIRAWCAL